MTSEDGLRGWPNCSARIVARRLIAAAVHPARRAQARMDAGSWLSSTRHAMRVIAGSPAR